MAFSSPQQSARHAKARRSKSSILQTQLHNVNHFGPQLPVLVAEAIAYYPGAKINASVQLNPESGWAWFVCQRKLFVWQLFNEENTPNQIATCRELLLPPSDLAVSSQHVTIFVQPDSKTASCVAITPDGLIRYWEVVSQHAPWTDVNANLGGEEVSAVHHIPPLGTLAVTTSATMILINPSKTKGGTPTVIAHRISPRSWFCGISKKMNSIIFGSVSNIQASEELKLVKVLTRNTTDNGWCIYLLAEMKLQYWLFSKQMNFDLKYEHDLEPMIKRALFGREAMMPESNEIEILVSDVNLVEGGIMVLAVIVEPRSYVLLHFPCVDGLPPTDGFKSCELSKRDIAVLEEPHSKVTQLQFLLLPADALFFNRKCIVAVPMGSGQIDGDKIEIPGGLMRGHNIYKNSPIFFSGTYGFVTISTSDTSSFDLLDRSTVEPTTTPKTIASREPSVYAKPECVDTIRSAFMLYIRKNMVQYRQVIEREFPNTTSGLNNQLAMTLVKMSLDIINGIPQKDPRWEPPSMSASRIASTTSLHMETQLSEKQKAHDLFLKFVMDISTFENLGKVTRMGVNVDTVHLLNEHNEKIIALHTFRKLQPKNCIILSAISHSIASMKFITTPKLSSQDFFYRYVSVADEGIRSLIKKTKEVADSSNSYEEVFKYLESAITIITEVVYSIIAAREKHGVKIDRTCPSWLSAKGKTGIFDDLMQLTSLTFDFLESTDEDDKEFKRVVDLFFQLADIVLFLQVDFPPLKSFEKLRDSLINCLLISPGTYMKAKQLAYKYESFYQLIDLAYLMQEEKTAINKYIETFGDKGFCEVLFKWLIDHNKCGDVLSLEIPVKFKGKLDTFLKPLEKLYWIHKLQEGNVKEAAEELAKIAIIYKKDALVQEKMLSLSKLLHLIAEYESEYSSEIENKLNFLEVQKSVSEHLLLRGKDTVPVCEPIELIEFLTGDKEYDCPDDLRFHTAFDVCKLIKDPELHFKLKTAVWVRAILKDPWDSLELNALDESFSHIFFYKLMEIICLSDETSKDLVPPLQAILDHEDIEPIVNNSTFRYIIQYAYDNVFEKGLTKLYNNE
ncbi:nuclear pore complex protein Nup133 [Cimex lectularius]|uniref:Nuclear pore complex protein Nup133 n=1 Tax=Cimex lectularius TaxID=79782 RepID=A0A8I6SJU1_CIMLE|nr:nuclear pore complex protein Nup133 [Cimex lectularius]